MRIEIIVTEEHVPNAQYARIPLSVEGLLSLPYESRKNQLYEAFERAYKNLTGGDVD